MNIADVKIRDRVVLAKRYALQGATYEFPTTPQVGGIGTVRTVDFGDNTVHVDYDDLKVSDTAGMFLWTDIGCLEIYEPLPDLTNLTNTMEWLDAEPQRP